MIRVFKGLAAAFLLLAATPAAAQEDGALSWLIGRWQGAGTMFGKPSKAVLDIRPALGGRFLELSYRAGGFEGRAFYRHDGGDRWRAHWFDNRATTFGITAQAGERMLRADWGSDETERGQTLYRLRDDGRLEVVDTVVGRNGDSREFARHVLTRAD